MSTVLGYCLVLALICCCWTGQGSALQCYQCASTNATGDCVTDIKGMVNSSVGIGRKYAKDCLDFQVGLDRCMILYKETKFNIEVFNRDCHDGKYFPEDYNSSLFQNVSSINQTVCDVIKGSVVCYRSCNTPFCNGPQPEICDFWRANKSIVIEDDEGEELECGAAEMFVKSGPLTTGLLCILMALVVHFSTSSVT